MDNHQPFQAYSTHATAAVATKAASAGKVHCITKISAVSDKATSVVIVKDGTTPIWSFVLGAAKWSEDFPLDTPLRGTAGNLVSVEVDSTARGDVLLVGYTIG